jgi:glycosidase
MSINTEYKTVNAEAQVKDPNSTFHFWSRVLALRKKYLDIFVYGDFNMVDRPHDKIFAFTRQFGSQKALVVCNWSQDNVEWTAEGGQVKEVLLNNYSTAEEAQGRFTGGKWSLKPYEACVLLVEA